MSSLEEFLAGERPDDVAFFVADAAVDDADPLADAGDRVDGGTAFVVDGERGRAAFDAAVGVDPFEFAQGASGTESHVDRSLSAGDCPEGDGDDHAVRFAFAFVQSETPDAGGRYAEGDVVHAYARCACGASYSDRWVAGDD
jgi:hypothetical protein